jgi:glucose-1-phosphatase
MAGIKNIIFDLGGVILNLDNARTEQAFASMGVRRFADHFGHGHADSFFRDYEVGKISDRQFIDALKALAHPDTGDEQIVNGWNAMLLDFPAERIAMLDDLRAHYRLFLFSNTNSLHLDHFSKTYRATFGPKELEEHFEKAYYSHLLGMRKPDPKPFEHILRENELVGSETLFVDDALVNVEGAITAGLKGFYLRPGMHVTEVDFENPAVS